MPLSTDDQTFTTITATNLTPSDHDAPGGDHGHGKHVLGWAAIAIALTAVAGLTVAVLRPDTTTPVHDNARTVARYGSIAAIDHRDQMILDSPSHTVAEHGSIAAIDHREQVIIASRTNSPSQTVAEHGSIAAIDHTAASG